jgi:anti-anti-sigma factor
MSGSNFIAAQRDHETLILTPPTSLGEIVFLQRELERKQVLDLLDDPAIKNVIIDFQALDYCGSSALALIIHFGEIAARRGGEMVFCNVSEHAREILKATHLQDNWLITNSRADALQAVSLYEAATLDPLQNSTDCACRTDWQDILMGTSAGHTTVG